jgi:hypothetical protein
MVNTKVSFLQACKLKNLLNLKENIKTICILADGNKQKLLIFESLTDTLNFRTVCYYLTNLINNPSSLKLPGTAGILLQQRINGKLTIGKVNLYFCSFGY